ncbi:MAG: GNAT family N-acetyltransferase [Bacteroidetes bacterium]|nr:GNAT family N-acetyltransferase [Bacteroidota bacterium]
MKSKNLLLRAPEPADIDLLYKWENDSRIWYLSNTVAPISRHLLEEYILTAYQDIYTAKQLRLMIDNVNTGETVGCIDLFDFDPVNLRAGIGILISDNQRNKGYASEALALLIDYAFNTLNLHQLYCNITTNNEVSLKLFKKHNFKNIGIKKDWTRLKDKWLDEYILQLINTNKI